MMTRDCCDWVMEIPTLRIRIRVGSDQSDQGIYTIFHDWPPVRVNITDHERCKSSSVFPEHSNGPYSGISAIERRDGQTGTSVTRGSRIPGVKEPSLHHYRQITKTRVKNPGIGHAL